MNNIDVLNDIMKPYFDKKRELEEMPTILENDVAESKKKMTEIRHDRLETKKALQLELEQLRVRKTVAFKEFEERKEKEIEDYITESLNSNPNLSSAYGSFVRKDLERLYEEKLQKLEEEFRIQEQKLLDDIKQLSTKSDEENLASQQYTDLSNKPDYTNVYLREMFEIKDDLKIKLFAERKKLLKQLEALEPEKEAYEKIVSDLNEKQSELKEIIDNLANFKYEYNDQNQVINKDEWKELYEKRSLILSEIEKLTEALSQKSEIIHQINDLNKSLEKVEEYRKLLEPTKEEIRSVMMTMTHWERKEYDRRKGLTTTSSSIVPLAETDRSVKKETLSDDLSGNPDIITFKDSVVSSYDIEDGKIVVDTKKSLLRAIFNDIIEEVKTVRSVRINPSQEELGSDEYYISTKADSGESYKEAGTVSLYEEKDEPIKLPNGEYVYSGDMKEAVDNYYDKNKAKTYVIKSTGKEYKVNLGTIMKFKASLKLCSAIKLIKENKIAKIDITRIHGKQKGDTLFGSKEIGTIYGKHNMPEGDYVNRNELIAKLNNLFTTKKLVWLKNIVEKLRQENTVYEDEVELESEEKVSVK